MNKGGVFCISLDFELHWGCLDSHPIMSDDSRMYFENSRRAVPRMLDIFKKGEMHVTWAIVGMLYRENKKEWDNGHPPLIPSYKNPQASTYEWINTHGFLDDNDRCHFAPELVEQVYQTPHQEIGTHTYSHYFCLEQGQTKEQFREDIRLACALAEEKGRTIRSLVFPRNQFNEEYLSVLDELGITSVRTNPDIWYWSYSDHAGSFLKRFFRAGDAYLKFQPIALQYLKDIDTSKRPLHLPATRLYRPWRPQYPIENKLKMRRILNEMTRAAQKGAYYHIWWHPENFGRHPEECLHELQVMVNHYHDLRDRYGFQNLTMGEITDMLLSNRHSNQ